MVARVDAVGICFSDAKLVRAGAAHARLRGRDLAAVPVTPGHEAALTVVGVGERRRGTVPPGRALHPAAGRLLPRALADGGLQLAGALAEYVVLGKEVLDGDEGCYLVPLPDAVGAVEGALIEPWTCVVAAYQIGARTHLRSGGTLRFSGFADQPLLDLAGVRFGGVPERLGVPLPAVGAQRTAAAAGDGRRPEPAPTARPSRSGALDWEFRCCGKIPRRRAARDDVVIAGTPPATSGWRRCSPICRATPW